jgi:hypothetical protein
MNDTRKETALKIYQTQEKLLENLYERWQIEKGYESLDEYAKCVQAELAKFNAVLDKMTQRPFGYVYTLMGATYSVSIAKSQYSYKRIS